MVSPKISVHTMGLMFEIKSYSGSNFANLKFFIIFLQKGGVLYRRFAPCTDMVATFCFTFTVRQSFMRTKDDTFLSAVMYYFRFYMTSNFYVDFHFLQNGNDVFYVIH